VCEWLAWKEQSNDQANEKCCTAQYVSVLLRFHAASMTRKPLRRGTAEFWRQFSYLGRRAHPLRAFVVSILQFSRFAPPSQIQRDTHTSVAQFIGIATVGQSPRHEHSSYAERRHGLRLFPTRLAGCWRAALEYAHHGAKHGLKRPLCAETAARYVRGQGRHRARILHVLKMLP